METAFLSSFIRRGFHASNAERLWQQRRSAAAYAVSVLDSRGMRYSWDGAGYALGGAEGLLAYPEVN